MTLSLFPREATTSSLAYYKRKRYPNEVFLNSPGLEGGVSFCHVHPFCMFGKGGCDRLWKRGLALGMMDVVVGVAGDISPWRTD